MNDELSAIARGKKIATSLNISETPYEKLSGVELKVVDDRQYLLGTKVLQEEISTLEARKTQSVSSFVPELRKMEYWKTIIESDLEKLTANTKTIDAFHLASPATASLDPIKPRKLLILLAAIFLSGIIAVVITLSSHAIMQHRDKTE